MKRLTPLAALLLAGCMSPDWVRLIPENKDAHIVISTPYGTATIDTRVNPTGTNGLGPLPLTLTPVQGVLLK